MKLGADFASRITDNLEPVSGPIFLTGLPCSDTDRTVEDCFDGGDSFVGITPCDHSRDVFVTCEGNDFTVIMVSAILL